MATCNYQIVEQTNDYVLLRDLGPWDRYKTITNAAEEVIKELGWMLNGRRLEYYDSAGERTEILITENKFAGFRAIDS